MEKYEAPEFEMIIFESEDIITSSGCPNQLPITPVQPGIND